MSRESGGISKLVIKAYSDNKFTSSTGEYTASINPEDISVSGGIDYHLSQGMGSPGTLRYNTSRPKLLTFKLLFDNTGIIPGSDAVVEEQIGQLKKVIYDVQENINSPYYVRIIWGVIDFKGRLSDLDINYTRFKAEGLPIRAEAFVRVVEEKEAPVNLKSSSQVTSSPSPGSEGPTSTRGGSASGERGMVAAASTDAGAGTAAGTATSTGAAGGPPTGAIGTDATAGKNDKTASKDAQANKTSSSATNNTKSHQVKEGETLASVSKDALGDPKLAPSLAKLNGLDSLRGLPVGLRLALPFSVGALLAGLLEKASDYAKKGSEWVKEKGSEAKDKAQEKGEKAKEKGSEAKDNVQEKGEKAKEKGSEAKDEVKK